MPTIEHASLLRSITAKLSAQQLLDEAEKEHLAGCEACLRELVNHLDKAMPANNGINGSASTTRPEAERVLNRARQIFLREFGIDLATKQHKESYSASA